jgi:hypothetical protein
MGNLQNFGVLDRAIAASLIDTDPCTCRGPTLVPRFWDLDTSQVKGYVSNVHIDVQLVPSVAVKRLMIRILYRFW